MSTTDYARCAVLFSLIVFCCTIGGCQGGGGNTPGFESAGVESGQPVAEESTAGTHVFQVVMQPQRKEDAPRGVSMVSPGALLGQLPELPLDKDPSCSGSGFILDGGAYTDDLEAPNMSRSGDYEELGIYSPAYDGAGLETAAYAFYRWNLRGYSGAQTIGFEWTAGLEPADYGDLYIGLGNLSDGTWDWYRGPQDKVLTIGSFGPYREADGDMLMAVVLLGSASAELVSMEAGVSEERATGDEDGPGDEPEYPLLLEGGDLPSSVDLSPYCAPINDQMTWGSCTAFGVGDGAYNYELNQLYRAYGWDLQNPKYRVSPKHLYIVSGELQGFPAGGGYGRWTSAVIAGLLTHGVATELNAPYDLVYDNNWSGAALADATVLTIEDYREIPCNTWEGINTVKTVLAQQRKVLPMRAYLDSWFMDYQAGEVWNFIGPYSVGGHAMCIVGYDDSLGVSGAFKVRNSWSGDWGDTGHVWIAYEAFLNPAASVRCWTLTDEYNPEVITHFSLNEPDGPPVTGVVAGDGTSADGIEIAWDVQAAALQYRIYRDEMTNLVATLGMGASGWLDTDIDDSYGHVYWVRADNGQLSVPDTGYRAAQPEIKEISPTVVTEGDEVTFSAAGLGSGPLTYAWNFDGGATPNTSSDARPTVIVGTPGDYSVSLTLSNNLGSDTYDFTLTVNPLPPIIEYIAGRCGFSGDVINPAPHLTGTPTEYAWDFGGASVPNISTASHPAITLGAPGLYDASLRVSNGITSDIYYFTVTVLDGTNRPWRMDGHDSRASGQSPVNGPVAGNLRWKLFVGEDYEYGSRFSIRANPVFDSAGNVYFGVDGYDNFLSKLMSVTADGELRWSFAPADENTDFRYVMMTEDDLIITTTSGGGVYALDSAGNELWSVHNATSTSSNPVVTDDGVVYFVSGDKHLYSFNLTDGSEHWPPFECSAHYNARSPLIMAPNGLLFFQGEWDYHWKLFAYNTVVGAPVGSLRLYNPFKGFALSPDGITLYGTDDDGAVFAYDTNTCQQIWKYPDTRASGNNYIGPRVGADGTVYGVNPAGVVYALDPDTGEMLWTCELGDEYNSYDSRPAIGCDGTLYLGSPTNRIYAVKDGSLLWTYTCEGNHHVTGDPSISPDGTLLISQAGGWLYAIGPGDGDVFSPPFVEVVLPESGDAGTEQTFNAFLLQGSEPVSYAWDFRTGATPRYPTDPAPTVTLGDIGTYNCHVDVSNDYGSSRFYFDLEVTDPNAPPEWHFHRIGDLSSDVDMGAAIINGRPAVCCDLGLGSHTTYFYHSAVAEPVKSSDWVRELIQNDHAVIGSIQMLEVAGQPAMVYRNDNVNLRYMYRTETGWEYHDICSMDLLRYPVSFKMVDGKPAVAFVRIADERFRLYYAYSTVAVPTSTDDWIVAMLDAPDVDVSTMELVDNNGKPNIVLRHRDESDNFYFYYAQATSATPAPADWSWYLFTDEIGCGDSARLMLHNGLPTIAYTVDQITEKELRYAQATVAVTTSAADWVTHSMDAAYQISLQQLLTIDGRPAMAYPGRSTEKFIGLAWADVTEPAVMGDWSVLHSEGSIGINTALDVNGTPVIIGGMTAEGIVYCYLD